MQLLAPTIRISSYIPPPTYKSLQILTIVRTEIVGKGYGMPSSHAQFVAFFSLSLTLFPSKGSGDHSLRPGEARALFADQLLQRLLRLSELGRAFFHQLLFQLLLVHFFADLVHDRLRR